VSKIKYSISAKETEYQGRLFRSRLEARWAAFFDLIGWDWEYEPLDLEGWSPDFLIKGTEDILVEVKPITEIDYDTCKKIDRAYPNGRVLLLGCITNIISFEKTVTDRLLKLDGFCWFRCLIDVNWSKNLIPFISHSKTHNNMVSAWSTAEILYCENNNKWGLQGNIGIPLLEGKYDDYLIFSLKNDRDKDNDNFLFCEEIEKKVRLMWNKAGNKTRFYKSKRG
jgi:hypothetical protein